MRWSPAGTGLDALRPNAVCARLGIWAGHTDFAV